MCDGLDRPNTVQTPHTKACRVCGNEAAGELCENCLWEKQMQHKIDTEGFNTYFNVTEDADGH